MTPERRWERPAAKTTPVRTVARDRVAAPWPCPSALSGSAGRFSRCSITPIGTTLAVRCFLPRTHSAGVSPQVISGHADEGTSIVLSAQHRLRPIRRSETLDQVAALGAGTRSTKGFRLFSTESNFR